MDKIKILVEKFIFFIFERNYYEALKNNNMFNETFSHLTIQNSDKKPKRKTQGSPILTKIRFKKHDDQKSNSFEVENKYIELLKYLKKPVIMVHLLDVTI